MKKLLVTLALLSASLTAVAQDAEAPQRPAALFKCQTADGSDTIYMVLSRSESFLLFDSKGLYISEGIFAAQDDGKRLAIVNGFWVYVWQEEKLVIMTMHRPSSLDSDEVNFVMGCR